MSDTGNVHLINPPARALARPECTVAGCIDVAGYVMPQVTIDITAQVDMADPLNWTHVLVCAMHKNGWWDGDDPVAGNYPLANPAGFVLTPNPRMETSA